MPQKKILGMGAEAIIIKKSKTAVQKKRIAKSYRHPTLDVRLRKIRTRSETKIIQTLTRQGIPVPTVIESSDTNMTIDMSFVDGKKVRDELTIKNFEPLCKQLGTTIAKMHNLNVVHSDLTTSNMILRNKEIIIIDFGLSYFSLRTEDKAVDLHLLKQALDSYHFDIAQKAFKIVLSAYKKEIKDKQVLLRLGIVEKRGKNKQ